MNSEVHDHRDKPAGLRLSLACPMRLMDSRMLYRPFGSRENGAIANIDRRVEIGVRSEIAAHTVEALLAP